MKLSVLVPVYNEISTIEELISRVRAVPVDKEIIVVDNCSTDGTREKVLAMQYPELRVILQERNQGKGGSVKRAIAAAQGEFLVVQDADLEYNPQDYLVLLEAAQRPDTYAVLGSRMAGMRAHGTQLPLSFLGVGRRLLNWYFQALFASPLSDIATCYKMARRETLQSLNLRCNGFDLDFELTAKLVRGARREGKRVVEVPISYKPRTFREGKKIRWQDGLGALWAITRFRFVD